jgi:hypothetical protein
VLWSVGAVENLGTSVSPVAVGRRVSGFVPVCLE